MLVGGEETLNIHAQNKNYGWTGWPPKDGQFQLDLKNMAGAA